MPVRLQPPSLNERISCQEFHHPNHPAPTITRACINSTAKSTIMLVAVKKGISYNLDNSLTNKKEDNITLFFYADSICEKANFFLPFQWLI